MVTVSGAALFLYAFAFTGATFLIMGFVDSCNIVNIPTLTEAGWTKELCYEVSANWMKAVPRGKEAGGELLVMFFHIIFRIEQNFIGCSALVAWYTLFFASKAARKPYHLFLTLVAFACAGSDSLFAGLPVAIGTSALQLSDAARGEIAIPFIPLWITIGVLNGIAFFTSPKEKTA